MQIIKSETAVKTAVGVATSEEESVASAVVLWILVGCFFALFVVVGARFFWLACFEERRGITVRKATHGLLCVPLLARALDMSIWHANYLHTDLQKQNVPEIVIGGAPGYFFFSAYSLLFCLWIVLAKAARGRGSSTTKKTILKYYVGINVAVLFTWAVLVVLMTALSGHDSVVVHEIELVFAASLALVSAAVFISYGAVIYRRFSSKPFDHSTSQSMAITNQIGLLAATFTTTLSIRSVLMLVIWFSDIKGPVASMMLRVVSQTLCELIPITVAIVILWKPISSSKRDSLLSSTTSSISDVPEIEHH